jgi:hypothetical protein
MLAVVALDVTLIMGLPNVGRSPAPAHDPASRRRVQRLVSLHAPSYRPAVEKSRRTTAAGWS